MKNIVCYFSGWFSTPIEDCLLVDPETSTIQTAEKWLKQRGNIDGLILENFSRQNEEATDGEYSDITLEIEEE